MTGVSDDVSYDDDLDAAERLRADIAEAERRGDHELVSLLMWQYASLLDNLAED